MSFRQPLRSIAAEKVRPGLLGGGGAFEVDELDATGVYTDDFQAGDSYVDTLHSSGDVTSGTSVSAPSVANTDVLILGSVPDADVVLTGAFQDVMLWPKVARDGTGVITPTGNVLRFHAVYGLYLTCSAPGANTITFRTSLATVPVGGGATVDGFPYEWTMPEKAGPVALVWPGHIVGGFDVSNMTFRLQAKKSGGASVDTIVWFQSEFNIICDRGAP